MFRWASILTVLVLASCAAADGTKASSSQATATAVVASAAVPSPAATQSALWRTTSAPSGAAPGSDWIAVDAFDGKTLVAQVNRGAIAGPLPVLVMLHPDGGLRRRFTDFSTALANAGFLTVTPCWAQGVDPIDPPMGCSADAPARNSAANLTKDVMAIAAAARTLPGARADQVAFVGHSGGAQAAFIVGSLSTNINAVVAISAGYGPNIRQRWGTTLPDQLDALRVPLLIVHGTADFQGPGTAIELVRAFEKSARDKGKNIEALYVDGAPHGLPYAAEFWTPEVQSKVVAFLKKQLS